MTATQQAETYSLELTHTFSAPRDTVFNAWTEGEQILQWFGSEASKTLEATVDLRVGGEWSMTLRLANGQRITFHGAFREVVVPEKLVYTWSYSTPELGVVRDSVVTVEFRERGEWTELSLRHEALPDQAACDRHEEGWKGCFESLESHMKTT